MLFLLEKMSQNLTHNTKKVAQYTEYKNFFQENT